MAGGYVNLPADAYEGLRRRFETIDARLRELERPTGSQYYDSLKKITDLVNNLAEEIENVSASGATWQGPVAAGSGNIVTTSGDFYTPHGRATPVVTSYVAAYLNTDGRIGATVSAERFKQDIEPRAYTLEQIAMVQVVSYRLRTAVAELGAQAQVEVGVIAEQLVEAGLSEFVVFDEDGAPFTVNYDRLDLLGVAGAGLLLARVKAIESRLEDAGL
jgi:hypothetical protein